MTEPPTPGLRLLAAARAHPRVALASALALAAVYPVVQNIYQLHNIDLWFEVLLHTPLNLGLLAGFVALFGLSNSLLVYNLRHGACKWRDSSTGWAGTAMAFFFGVCPGCASLATFVVPSASAALFINTNSTYFMFLVLGLMLLAVHLNRGFRRE
ncbi:MAG: hypothetical protein HY558_05690 [Euryarchaeota archaeon]|nr:hypothetical protein [Euryarchaeota archaeon]